MVDLDFGGPAGLRLEPELDEVRVTLQGALEAFLPDSDIGAKLGRLQLVVVVELDERRFDADAMADLLVVEAHCCE